MGEDLIKIKILEINLEDPLRTERHHTFVSPIRKNSMVPVHPLEIGVGIAIPAIVEGVDIGIRVHVGGDLGDEFGGRDRGGGGGG